MRTGIGKGFEVWSAAVMNGKSAGRGSNGKTTAYGVKKLRELILELAVRGKLAPQDPADEPASVLLEKIIEEKTRLFSAGDLKKQKASPEICNDVRLFELPDGWTCARLGDVVDVVRGITFPASEKSKAPATGRIACLRTSNVQDKVEWDDLLYIREQFVKRQDQFLKRYDVVMSMANSRELVGKVAIVESDLQSQATFGGFLGVLRTWLWNPFYLLIFLRVPSSRNLVIDSASQTTNIANISLGKLRPLVIPLPPLAEQHRIVAKVDELMALCDALEAEQSDSMAAHERLVECLLGTLTAAEDGDAFAAAWRRIADHFDTLFTTEHSIDQLKQTILQLAVMGKLVPQDPADEPASVLLERIAEEKARLEEQKKLKKQKPLPKVVLDETPFDLPNGWEWARFPEIGELARGKSKHRPRNAPMLYAGGCIPLVQTGDVARAAPKISTYTALYNENGLRQSRLWPKGTMCITIAANIADTGILDFDACFPDSVVGFIPFDERIDVGYFDYFVRTAKNHLEEYAPSTAQKNINLEILGNLLVPLPPIGELNRIVAKVDELLALCDALKARLSEAQTTQVGLADAVVAQAIR